jgi:signal transduction histidine kinase
MEIMLVEPKKAIDINLKQRVELMHEEIRKSEDTNSMLRILDGIDDVIYIADPETYELIYGNRTFISLWGDYKKRKCYKVLQNRNSPCPFCTNHLIFGDKTGETYYWEFQNEINKRWYRCADKAIEWIDGRTVRFELAGDITENKMLELELKEKNKELELLNELNNRLFSIIAHDIRSPVAHAKTLTEFFNIKSLSREEFTQHLLKFSERTDDLLNFIDDILRWAKYQSKNQNKLNLSIFSTDIAINQTIRLYQHLIDKKKINLSIKNIKCEGYADKDLYALITRNLIQNAVKFTPHGKSITISVEERENTVDTIIEDTGVGISKNIIDKIINDNTFYSTPGTDAEKGSGLGLMMCLKYAQMQNGKIHIESELNKGTRIVFQIPGKNSLILPTSASGNCRKIN